MSGESMGPIGGQRYRDRDERTEAPEHEHGVLPRVGHQPALPRELRELVDAITDRDPERLAALRQEWHRIGELVQGEAGDRLDEQVTDPALRTALALWLSTPPDRHEDDTGIPAAVDDEVRAAGWSHRPQIDSLFATLSMSPEKLARRVREALAKARYPHADEWLAAGHAYLDAGLRRDVQQLTAEERARVVGGYAAAIGGLLVREPGDPHDASLPVQPLDGRLVLVAHDSTPIELDVTGRAIFDWSGIDQDLAQHLGHAMSFVLPVASECLPNLAFEVDRSGCRLRSLLVDALARPATEPPDLGILEVHRERLVGYAQFMFGFDEATAEDVVSEAFATVFCKLPELPFLTAGYLHGAVCFAARAEWRRRERRAKHEVRTVDDRTLPELVAADRGIGSSIDAADLVEQSELVPGARFLLESAAGLSSREIAARHGKTVGAVDQAKSRARRNREFAAIEQQVLTGTANATYAGGIGVSVVAADGSEVEVDATPITRLRLGRDGVLRGRLRVAAPAADFALLALTDRNGARALVSAPFRAAIEAGELELAAIVHAPSRSDMGGDGIEWPASCVQLWLFAA